MKIVISIPNPIVIVDRWFTRMDCSLKDKYEPYKPGIEGCKAGRHGFHKWNWSRSWNGNDKRVLPWMDPHRTTGIGRSGHRCYHCGEFRWEERDEIWSLNLAYNMGYLPDVKNFIRTGNWPKEQETKDAA